MPLFIPVHFDAYDRVEVGRGVPAEPQSLDYGSPGRFALPNF